MTENNNPRPNLIGTEPRDFLGQWQLAYQKAFKLAQNNHPGDETEQRAVATREANRLYNVDEPEDYYQAMAIEPWKLGFRGVVGGRLCVIGVSPWKKYFDVPAESGRNSRPNKGGAKE